MTIQMEFHEYAGIFPLMEDDELKKLAADIQENGLREPIWTFQNKIIDGRNRYRACLMVNVRPEFREWSGVGSMIAFIVSLNLHRRHLSTEQRIMVAARIKPMFEEEARKRQEASRAKPGEQVGQVSANLRSPEEHKAADDAARAMNVSPRSVEYGSKVLAKGTPELVEAVDAGKVSISAAATIAELPKPEQQEIVARGKEEILQRAKEIRAEKSAVVQEQRKQERAEALKIQPPSGHFRTIVVDPPWPMQKFERDVRPNQTGSLDYPVMTLDEIKAMPIPASEECHVYLWTTQKFLPDAFEILSAWGMKYIFTMVWHKPGGPQPFGLPQYNCEFVLFGRKGALEFLDTKAFPTCFQAPRREHSRKPDEFYEMVRRVSPEPRIDIFSREARDGFAQFGNETGKFTA